MLLSYYLLIKKLSAIKRLHQAKVTKLHKAMILQTQSWQKQANQPLLVCWEPSSLLLSMIMIISEAPAGKVECRHSLFAVLLNCKSCFRDGMSWWWHNSPTSVSSTGHQFLFANLHGTTFGLNWVWISSERIWVISRFWVLKEPTQQKVYGYQLKPLASFIKTLIFSKQCMVEIWHNHWWGLRKEALCFFPPFLLHPVHTIMKQTFA